MYRTKGFMMGSPRFYYHCCWSLSILSLLLVSCGKSEVEVDNSVTGQLRRAMKIQNMRLRSKKLLSIADTQFEHDDKVNGKATIGLAADTAKQIKIAYDRGAALNSAAYTYAKHELLDKSSDVLKESYRTVADIEEADLAVAILAKIGEIQLVFLDQLNTGEQMFQEAGTLAEKATKPEQKVRAKMNLAFYFHRLKRVDPRDELIQQSFALLGEVSDARQRSDVTVDMASRLLQIECEDLADQAFEQAEKEATSIEDPLSQGYALCEISGRLSSAKRVEAAQRVRDQAREVAEKVADEGLRGELLKRIAND